MQKIFGHRLYNFVFLIVIVFTLASVITTYDDDDIPTDEKTWNECCSHDDCVQGRVTITDIQGGVFWIEFNNDPEFFVDKRKVYPSSNGKEYVCWLEFVTDDEGESIGRPTDENVLCVFKLYHMAKFK